MRVSVSARVKKRVVKISSSIIVLLLILIFSTWTHWWWRAFTFSVTVNGKSSPSSKVYVQGESLLVCIQEPPNSKYEFCYLIHPQANKVGLSGGASIFHFQPMPLLLFPGAVYSNHVPPLETSMGSAKVETAPNLIKTSRSFAFTSFYNSRVNVSR